MMRSILVGILILMAAGVGFLTFEWYRQTNSGEAYGAPFSLIDENGEQITQAAFRGHPSVVFFGFTHCPEVCPTTLFEMNGWLETIGDEGKNLKAYFVSIDPARDTPETMKLYVSNLSNRIKGITGDPDKVYAMAKSGLNAMTVALADALGPKVRVNCILPGAILTDISKAWSPETIDHAHDTPMGRAGYAEDFPGAALFFASEASAWITGTCLRVDGGMAKGLGL